MHSTNSIPQALDYLLWQRPARENLISDNAQLIVPSVQHCNL